MTLGACGDPLQQKVQWHVNFSAFFIVQGAVIECFALIVVVSLRENKPKIAVLG